MWYMFEMCPVCARTVCVCAVCMCAWSVCTQGLYMHKHSVCTGAFFHRHECDSHLLTGGLTPALCPRARPQGLCSFTPTSPAQLFCLGGSRAEGCGPHVGSLSLSVLFSLDLGVGTPIALPFSACSYGISGPQAQGLISEGEASFARQLNFHISKFL